MALIGYADPRFHKVDNIYAGFISSFVFRHFWRQSYQNQLSFSGKDTTADFFVFRQNDKTKDEMNLAIKSKNKFIFLIYNFSTIQLIPVISTYVTISKFSKSQAILS